MSSGTDSINPVVEQLRLYQVLTQMGNIYELDFSLNAIKIEEELQRFSDRWVQYNPYKPGIDRQGLSVTSLDGGLGGEPDLHSLREYERRTGRAYRERDFRKFTPVYQACTEIQPLLSHFSPHLGRCHFLRFGIGGCFPPHRDGAGQEYPDSFRVLVPLRNASKANFVFLYDGQRVSLEIGRPYFVNTLVAHSVFAFGALTILVCNVLLNKETVSAVQSKLESY